MSAVRSSHPSRRRRQRGSRLAVVVGVLIVAIAVVGSQSGGLDRGLRWLGESLGVVAADGSGEAGAATTGSGSSTSGSTALDPTTSSGASSSARSGASPDSITTPPDAEPMVVEHVHDGDTLFVTTAGGSELKVRLIGIDTPELDSECHGEDARSALRALLPVGATVLAAHDAEPQDRYGRELLYLWTRDGAFVNLGLVSDGHGEALKVGANDAYWPQLAQAEASARAAGRGMWGAC